VRRLVRFAIALTLGILAILWAAYTVAFYKFNDAALGRFISNRVEAVDRGQFRLIHARYPYWGGLLSILANTPAHVVGEDFTLVDPDGGTVIRVPHVDADIHLRELILSLGKTALFGGRRLYLTLHFSHARIPGGWGVIGPTRSTWGQEKTETNIVAAMSSKKPSGPSTGAFVIQVDEAELADVGFAMGFSATDGKPSWWTKTSHLWGKAALLYSSAKDLATADGSYFFFRILDASAPTAQLQLGEYQFPLAPLRADEFGVHGQVRQTLHFSATAHVFGAGVRATGALTDAYSEHPGVDLTLDFDHGRGLMALLDAPLSTWLGGDPRGRIRIAGPFSHPVIDGEVAEIDANIEGIPLARGTARLHFEEGLLTLRPAAGHIAHGEASADVDVELRAPKRWSALLTVRGVNPAEVPRLPKSLAMQLAGRLDARVKLAGNWQNHPERIAFLRLGGELVRQSGGGQLPRKLTIAGGGEYTPTQLTVTGLSAGGEGVTVAADGTIDPRDGRVAGSVRLDGQSGAPLLSRWGLPSGMRFESVHASGRIFGALARPTLALHAVASNVAYERRTLEHLEADLALRGGTLAVTNLVGNGLGATVSGSAELDLFDGDVPPARGADAAGAAFGARAVGGRGQRLAAGGRRRRRRGDAGGAAAPSARPGRNRPAQAVGARRRLHRRAHEGGAHRRRRASSRADAGARARRLGQRPRHHRLERRARARPLPARFSAGGDPVAAVGAGADRRHALGRSVARRHRRSPGARRHPVAARVQGPRRLPRQRHAQARPRL
jgi:hypothetical protein